MLLVPPQMDDGRCSRNSMLLLRLDHCCSSSSRLLHGHLRRSSGHCSLPCLLLRCQRLLLRCRELERHEEEVLLQLHRCAGLDRRATADNRCGAASCGRGEAVSSDHGGSRAGEVDPLRHSPDVNYGCRRRLWETEGLEQNRPLLLLLLLLKLLLVLHRSRHSLWPLDHPDELPPPGRPCPQVGPKSRNTAAPNQSISCNTFWDPESHLLDLFGRNRLCLFDLRGVLALLLEPDLVGRVHLDESLLLPSLQDLEAVLVSPVHHCVAGAQGIDPRVLARSHLNFFRLCELYKCCYYNRLFSRCRPASACAPGRPAPPCLRRKRRSCN